MGGPSPNPTGEPLVPSRAISFGLELDAPERKGEDVVETVTRKMPYDGVVSQIYIDFPSGTQDRAGFEIVDAERGETQLPFDEETDYATFDGVSEFWPVSFPMRKDEEIGINYINTNWNVDTHLLKVWIIFVGENALPYTLDDLAERDGVNI